MKGEDASSVIQEKWSPLGCSIALLLAIPRRPAVITAIVLIFLLVFMIWPESRRKLELFCRRRLPRLYDLTFQTVHRYHADVEKRFPTSPQRKRLR
jgi:hypothetical protein